MATNPLDNLASGKPAGWDNNFRVPQIPKIRESISGTKLTDGLASHDQAMELWRRSLEKSVQERIDQIKAGTPTGASAVPVTPAVASAGTTVVIEGAVKSVNGETGDVALATDQVPQGAVNKYMTEQGWQDFYDRDGYGRNYIGFGEVIRIPAGKNRVNTGPLVIDGQLIIDGYFAAV